MPSKPRYPSKKTAMRTGQSTRRSSAKKSVSTRERTRRKMIRDAKKYPGVKEAMEVFNSSTPLQIGVLYPYVAPEALVLDAIRTS
jgi:hypothetical protein